MATVGASVDKMRMKSEKLGSAWQSYSTKASAAAGVMTGPLLGGIAAVGVAATITGGTVMRFDDAMLQLEATTGATASQMEAMEEQAKSLGKTTRFSATEAGNAQNFLAMAGFQTEEILSALPATLDLAAAANLDLATSADIASNIMGQFQIQAEDTARVTNVLAATASSSNTTVGQLAEGMKYLGPTAQSLGISLEDTAAMIGVLGDAGIQGSLAGRALGSSLVRLADPTKKMQDAMSAMNVEVFDMQGNFVGMESMLGQISTATAGMTQEQKAANINAMFGAEAFQEINILLNKGAGEYAAYADSISGTNKAQEMAAIRAGGLSGIWLGIKSALEALQLEFAATEVSGRSISEWAGQLGTKFLELARSVDFEAVFGWVQDNMEIVSSILGGLGAMILAVFVPAMVAAVAAIAPFVAAGMAVAGMIYLFQTNQQLFYTVLAGIAAFIYMVVLPALWAKVVALYAVASAWLAAIWPVALVIIAVMAVVFIIWWLVENWDMVIKAIGDALNWVWQFIVTVFMAIVNFYIWYYTTLWNIISGAWNATITFIVNALLKVWNGIVYYWNIITLFYRTALAALVHIVRSQFDQIKNRIMSVFDAIRGINLVQAGKDVINGLIDGIGSMATALTNKVSNMAGSIVGTMKSTLGIQSPSVVIKRKIMDEGVRPAITNSLDELVPDIQTKTRNVSNAMVPDATGVGRFAGASGGNNYELHIHIDNASDLDLSTDEGVDDFIDKHAARFRRKIV